jgi:hypothetical protein
MRSNNIALLAAVGAVHFARGPSESFCRGFDDPKLMVDAV